MWFSRQLLWRETWPPLWTRLERRSLTKCHCPLAFGPSKRRLRPRPGGIPPVWRLSPSTNNLWEGYFSSPEDLQMETRSTTPLRRSAGRGQPSFWSPRYQCNLHSWTPFQAFGVTDTMNSTRIITAFPPPPGVTPNFVNPDFNGKQIIVAGIVLPLLMFPFLGARLYSKYVVLKKIHCDDCTFSSQLTNKNIQLILIHRHDNSGCGRLLLSSHALAQRVNQIRFLAAIHACVFYYANAPWVPNISHGHRFC